VIREKLADLSELIGGYDFAEVIAAYWRGYDTGNEQLRTDARCGGSRTLLRRAVRRRRHRPLAPPTRHPDRASRGLPPQAATSPSEPSRALCALGCVNARPIAALKCRAPDVRDAPLRLEVGSAAPRPGRPSAAVRDAGSRGGWQGRQVPRIAIGRASRPPLAPRSRHAKGSTAGTALQRPASPASRAGCDRRSRCGRPADQPGQIGRVCRSVAGHAVSLGHTGSGIRTRGVRSLAADTLRHLPGL
jgi:hypothetical protein